MLGIAVLEADEKKRKVIRELLLKEFFELDIKFFWFTTEGCFENIKKYSHQLQLALISLDANQAMSAGRRIYESNPNCLICYYSEEIEFPKPIIKSRPISFLKIPGSYFDLSRLDRTELIELDDTLKHQYMSEHREICAELRSIISDVFRENGLFVYSTRKMDLSIPIRNILYFQSDLKHVIVHYCDGSEDKIFCKLKDIEEKLKDSGNSQIFIRVHNSFLVNSIYCCKIDKAGKYLITEGLEKIPISASHYSDVLDWFNRKNTFSGDNNF